jgi:starch synthase (maltosyl-transferring)
MPALSLDWADRFPVVDELTGAQFEWGQYNYVELGPHREVAHILHIVGGSAP